LTVGIAYNTSIIRDGLVLHLDAANIKSYPGSGISWNDLSGNGNNGTLINGVGYSSANRGAMTFDGTNDHASFITDPLQNITQAITIDFVSLISANTVGVRVPPIITRGSTSSAGGSLSHTLIYYEGPTNELVSQFGNTNGTAGSRVRTPYTLNTIEHYTVTYDGSIVSLYKNGELKNTASQSGAIYNNTGQQPTAIGRDVRYSIGVSGRMLNGRVYNMKIYNRALTAAEIRQNFEATRGRYSI
jgi:hypothetical protein